MPSLLANGTVSLRLARSPAPSGVTLLTALPTVTANGTPATVPVAPSVLTATSPTSVPAPSTLNVCGTPSPLRANLLVNSNPLKALVNLDSKFATGTLEAALARPSAPSPTLSSLPATAILAANGLATSPAAKPDVLKSLLKAAASPTPSACGLKVLAVTLATSFLTKHTLVLPNLDALMSLEPAPSPALPFLHLATPLLRVLKDLAARALSTSALLLSTSPSAI